MIAEMVKVQIAALARDEDGVLSWLQDEEVLHVTVLRDGEPTRLPSHTDLDHRLAQTQFALEFIDRVKNELNVSTKRSWRTLFASKQVATLANLEHTLRSLGLDERLKEIHAISDSLAKLKAEQQDIEQRMALYEPWSGLELTGRDAPADASYVRHALLAVSLQEDLLVKRLLQDIPTLILQEVKRVAEKKHGMVYLEVVVHRDAAASLDEVIARTSAELVKLSLPGGVTIGEQVQTFQDRMAKLKRDYQKTLKKAGTFVKMEREMQMAFDALLHRKERLVVQEKAVHLPLTVVLNGWVPRYRLDSLQESLEEAFETASVEETEPAKNEVPPVALRNSALIRPFETVTEIYGKPKYSELDPSGALSFFFLVAFGLALTDAGYGIVMMILMWSAEKFFQLKRGMRNMIRLLFYAGASTTLFGALTGGWFGINLEALPAGELRDILLSFKVIDPLSQPMTMLLVAFAVGIVQLLFAWVVRGYDHFRKGDYIAVVFDDVAWISMVIIFMIWAGTGRDLLPAAWERPALALVMLNAGILVLTQGRSHKNLLLKLGTGLLSLYGLVSFLSDTLSYSRLLALGLATGIIALVVNLIASLVFELVPGVGWLLAAIVLLAGHTFNLGINALGAFIHSGRLQFVEFFPKFLEGGGSAYKPFGRVGKYIDNPKDFV